VTDQVKIYQAIVGKIIRLIQDNQLEQGERLPSERQLAEIFKVSRHPVREAIRILEEKAVLVSRRGSGTFIANAQGPLLNDLLNGALRQEDARMEEIFQFRRMLEPQIAAQAAVKASARDLDDLTLIIKRQKAAADRKHKAELDQAFHVTLARATQNRTLLKVVERLTDILSESRETIQPNEERWSVSIAGHNEILRAVSAGDSKKALTAMEQHLYQVEAAVKKGESEL